MPGPADLTGLLQSPDVPAVRFGQGRITAWDSQARTNTVIWRGIPLHNLPVIASTTSMSLGVGDLVALLGWSPGGGPGTWWILGRVIPPGSPTTVTGSLAFRSDAGIDLARFGAAGDDSLWRLNYSQGGAALRAHLTGASDAAALHDAAGTPVLATDPSGHGLARPTLPLHLVPTAEAETAPGGPALWPSTAADEPVPLLTGTTPIWQRRIAIGVQTVTSDDATTAHWRLDLDGRTLTGARTGPGQTTVPIPAWGLDHAPGDPAEVTVYAWATGPGRIWLQTTRAHTLGDT